MQANKRILKWRSFWNRVYLLHAVLFEVVLALAPFHRVQIQSGIKSHPEKNAATLRIAKSATQMLNVTSPTSKYVFLYNVTDN